MEFVAFRHAFLHFYDSDGRGLCALFVELDLGHLKHIADMDGRVAEIGEFCTVSKSGFFIWQECYYYQTL